MNKIYKKLGEYIREIADVEMLDSLIQLELGINVQVDGQNFLDYLIQLMYPDIESTSIPIELYSNEANLLFCSYIYPKYKEMCIAYGYTEDEVSSNCDDFWRYLLTAIKNTYEENKVLIDIFAAEKSKLMNSVKASSTSKFDDTPQTKQTSGVYSYDDTHNTNVTIQNTENEVATKITRIAEIDQLIRNYYDRWANMCVRGLFFYEG